MKKTILFIGIYALIISFVGCSNKRSKTEDKKVKESGNTPVEIPDANFKTYMLSHFDSNNDGVFTVDEANAVKAIDCSGKEIADLTGIEKFINLETLNCSNNKLDELELRYNLKLNRLICTGNNKPLTIYIGMSSPLRNKNLQKPQKLEPNENPPTSHLGINPLDITKCTYDHDDTNIMVMFNE